MSTPPPPSRAEGDAAASAGKAGGRSLPRDVLLLVIGALISGLSSLLTSYTQSNLQRQQFVYERRIAILREAVELEDTVSVAEQAFIAGLQRQALLLDAGLDLAAQDADVNRVVQRGDEARGAYQAKRRACWITLYALFGEKQPPPKPPSREDQEAERAANAMADALRLRGPSMPGPELATMFRATATALQRRLDVSRRDDRQEFDRLAGRLTR